MILCDLDLGIVKDLKKTSETDIYLCRGGQFVGWLLENEMIDILKIKWNSLILGDGIRLFGSSSKQYQLQLMPKRTDKDGLSISSYQVKYLCFIGAEKVYLTIII